MAFLPPQYNIAGGKYWLPGHSPGAGDPADIDQPCQLYKPSRSGQEIGTTSLYGKSDALSQIRCDIAFVSALTPPYNGGIWGWGKPDGTPWYYRVLWWDWQHEGFPNQYILFLVLQCDEFGAIPDANR